MKPTGNLVYSDRESSLKVYENAGREQPFTVWGNEGAVHFDFTLVEATTFCIRNRPRKVLHQTVKW